MQGGHPKLDVMVDSGGRVALLDGLQGDGLHRELHSSHAGDEALKSPVCEWRASTIEFQDPFNRHQENRG